MEIRQQIMARGDGESEDFRAKQFTVDAKAAAAEAVAKYTGRDGEAA
jgi:hypothetical protein